MMKYQGNTYLLAGSIAKPLVRDFFAKIKPACSKQRPTTQQTRWHTKQSFFLAISILICPSMIVSFSLVIN